ncbi:MAG: hypothetical protein M3P14_11410 [Chloroflexota bacterium]|nr:hypothetical protein [Chloroflexota bacterium]
MRSFKILGFAGALVASAVVGGTLINAVAASHGTPSAGPSATTVADDSQPSAYCQTFLDTFASKLGVDESALLPAARAAADAAIDKAVADGKLTKAAADLLKQRVANANGNLCALLGARFPGLQRARVLAGIGSDMISAAAGSLHLSVADLKSKVVAGESLKQVAKDQSVDYASVTKAVHDAAKADLDKLVTAGRITADRENAVLGRIDRALKDGKFGNGGLMRPLPRPFAPQAPSSSSSPAGSTS